MDNREIVPRWFFPIGMTSPMEIARAMTVFAANCLLVEFHAMHSPIFLHSPGMTGQAADLGSALETPVLASIVPWGHVPFLFRRVPGDGEFVEEAIDFDQ